MRDSGLALTTVRKNMSFWSFQTLELFRHSYGTLLVLVPPMYIGLAHYLVTLEISLKSSNRFKARLTSQFPTTQLATYFPTLTQRPGAMICYVMCEGKWVVFVHRGVGSTIGCRFIGATSTSAGIFPNIIKSSNRFKALLTSQFPKLRRV